MLTDVMIAEIREIFSLFDKDADGFVETSQLGTIIRGLNMNPSEAEVAEMVKDVDPDVFGLCEVDKLPIYDDVRGILTQMGYNDYF